MISICDIIKLYFKFYCNIEENKICIRIINVNLKRGTKYFQKYIVSNIFIFNYHLILLSLMQIVFSKLYRFIYSEIAF